MIYAAFYTMQKTLNLQHFSVYIEIYFLFIQELHYDYKILKRECVQSLIAFSVRISHSIA